MDLQALAQKIMGMFQRGQQGSNALNLMEMLKKLGRPQTLSPQNQVSSQQDMTQHDAAQYGTGSPALTPQSTPQLRPSGTMR